MNLSIHVCTPELSGGPNKTMYVTLFGNHKPLNWSYLMVGPGSRWWWQETKMLTGLYVLGRNGKGRKLLPSRVQEQNRVFKSKPQRQNFFASWNLVQNESTNGTLTYLFALHPWSDRLTRTSQTLWAEYRGPSCRPYDTPEKPGTSQWGAPGLARWCTDHGG